MTKPFKPYWLIHEPGKAHGFAVVPEDAALTPAEAVAAYRKTEDGIEFAKYYGQIEADATLITRPFQP